MSKVLKMVTMVLVCIVILTLAVAGAAFADVPGVGPAPNSHDGIPDGSGFPDGSIPNGPSSEIEPPQNQINLQRFVVVMEVTNNDSKEIEDKFLNKNVAGSGLVII